MIIEPSPFVYRKCNPLPDAILDIGFSRETGQYYSFL
jgi:hypothetical protein